MSKLAPAGRGRVLHGQQLRRPFSKGVQQEDGRSGRRSRSRWRSRSAMAMTQTISRLRSSTRWSSSGARSASISASSGSKVVTRPAPPWPSACRRLGGLGRRGACGLAAVFALRLGGAARARRPLRRTGARLARRRRVRGSTGGVVLVAHRRMQLRCPPSSGAVVDLLRRPGRPAPWRRPSAGALGDLAAARMASTSLRSSSELRLAGHLVEAGPELVGHAAQLGHELAELAQQHGQVAWGPPRSERPRR